jgi:hypothetical protein
VSLFRISVYDGNRVFKCQIGDPSSMRVTVRHNLTGTLTMVLPLGHKRAPELLAEKARVRVLFRGEHLISGPVTHTEMETDGGTGTLTVTVEDDFRILSQVLGWQVPGAAISSQGSAEYKVYTGTAEAILKGWVTDNAVTRLALAGVTVAPNLNRGSTVPGGVPFRMHPGMDQLFPAVENAGLGVTVKQDGTNLVLDVYQPTVYPRSLSVKGRTLKSVQMTRSRPKASRAVVGGSGEGKDRYFRVVTDTARESLYGFCGEVFVDAASTGSDYTQLVKDVAAANADLKEANVELKEADRALDAAKLAQTNADMAFDLAQNSGNTTAASKAQTNLFAANNKVTSRTTDYNNALADRNAKQTTYNNLNGQLPAALTAYRAAMDEEGQKALVENGITNGVSITLAESDLFRYGPGGFHVGDRVPIKVTDDITITEVIRECTLEWVSPDYARVTPVVGDKTNEPERVIAQRLKALARGQRNQEKR